MQFSNTVRINRRPGEVFAFLSSFENLPLWNYAISETRRMGIGPSGVGARYIQTRKLPRPTTETFEVTELDPNSAVAIRGTLGPFRAHSRYELQEAGAGATALSNTMQLEPVGALGLVASLSGPRLKEAVAVNLYALKDLLERRAGGGSA